MISGRQIRAARALLDWSQERTGQKAGVSDRTIKKAEDEGGVSPSMLAKIQSAFEHHGVEFLPSDGVRMREASVSVHDGEHGLMAVWDDIYETILLAQDKDILIANNAEPQGYDPEVEAHLAQHIQRLGEIGAREKIIACEGDDNYQSGLIEYRHVPAEDFEDSPTIIYGDKIALWKYGPPARAIVIHDAWFAKSLRKLFGFAWKHARTPAREAPPLEGP